MRRSQAPPSQKCGAAHTIGMREVTYRTFPDGTMVVEVITTQLPIIQPAAIEPQKDLAAA